jgi:hypothetical protein
MNRRKSPNSSFFPQILLSISCETLPRILIPPTIWLNHRLFWRPIRLILLKFLRGANSLS